jgi:hypothetical protein
VASSLKRPSAGAAENRYSVDVRRNPEGWNVAIVDPDGADVSVRPCRDEVEALTYASTVRQHAYWLSERTFRGYYRLSGGPRGSSGERDRASGSPTAKSIGDG